MWFLLGCVVCVAAAAVAVVAVERTCAAAAFFIWWNFNQLEMILNRAKLHSLSFAMFYHSVEKYLFYSGEMQTLYQQINEARKKVEVAVVVEKLTWKHFDKAMKIGKCQMLWNGNEISTNGMKGRTHSIAYTHTFLIALFSSCGLLIKTNAREKQQTRERELTNVVCEFSHGKTLKAQC